MYNHEIKYWDTTIRRPAARLGLGLLRVLYGLYWLCAAAAAKGDRLAALLAQLS